MFNSASRSFVKLRLYLIFLIFTGRKVAIDASMSLYQFLIAVRSEGKLSKCSSKKIVDDFFGWEALGSIDISVLNGMEYIYS